MKKFLLLLFLFVGTVFADIPTALRAISSVPEGKKILNEAQKEGKIDVYFAPFPVNSNAMWNSAERAVVLNARHSFGYGEIVRSVLFEMHNAASDAEFYRLDDLAREGKLNRNQYIDAVEWVEHQNVLKTVRILDKGIRAGAFPLDAYWNVCRDFDSHLRVQKQNGHSQTIGLVYDHLMGYDQKYAALQRKAG